MRRTIQLTVACVAVLLTFTIHVQEVDALTITYSSRAVFDVAVGATTLEDFNSFGAEIPFHTIPLDVGDFTLSMTGAPSTDAIRNKIDLPPPAFPEFDVDGTVIANVLTFFGDSLFFTFDTPITAFGADFGALNDVILRTNVVVSGDVLTPAVTAGNQVRFFGVTSDTPFTTVEFRAVANDGYGIDNVSYIPEPSTLTLAALALLGLLGLLAHCHRRA